MHISNTQSLIDNCPFAIIESPALNHGTQRELSTTDKVIQFLKNSVIFKFIALAAIGALVTVAFSLPPVAALLIPTGISSEGLIASSLACFATMNTLYICQNFKEILFEASLIYTKLTIKNWYNEVTPNIILGALPFNEHFEGIKNLGTNAVLSMVDSFELENESFDIIHDWVDMGILQKHIPTQDFLGVPSDKIEEAVTFLEEQIKQGKKVYVHCKAGRGRSASVVSAYLMKHGLGSPENEGYIPPNSSLDRIYSFLKSKRAQVNLNSNQQKAINTWYNARIV